MVDGDRVYPVEYFFLHHSTGSDFKNASDLEVQDWYSNIGKDRGYSGGKVNPLHEHPSRPGQLTYAQAQFTLREYTLDGNKYGWRITDLIKNPWANVAWAVGNWFYNQRSSSVEICGNYLNKVLPDKALMCLADFLRQIDKELNGTLKVWLHQEVFSTACPGRIKEQRDKIVDMINRPDYWNQKLWPKPVITTKEIKEDKAIPYETKKTEDPTLPKGEYKITQVGVPGIKTTIYTVTYSDGKETSRKVKSESVTRKPQDELVSIGTYIEPTKDQEQDERISKIESLLQKIVDFLTSIFTGFKK